MPKRFTEYISGGRKSGGQLGSPIAAGALQVSKQTGREKTVILREKIL